MHSQGVGLPATDEAARVSGDDEGQLPSMPPGLRSRPQAAGLGRHVSGKPTAKTMVAQAL